MAVTTQPEPLLKSQPDVSKLNGFSGYTVTVTKHTAPRGSAGSMVVPTQNMPLKQVLELMTQIPLQYGPGFYKFSVADTGGAGEDAWMVKLGPDIAPQESSMPSPPFGPAGPFTSVPNLPPGAAPPPGAPALDSGVRQIAPGWFYNDELSLLTTPWRETIQWKIGDPMPKPPGSAHQQQGQQPQNPQGWAFPGWNGGATPWNPGSGWGAWPATDTKSSEVELLKQQLAEKERREEERAREERHRQEREREREDQRRRDEAMAERFEKLFAAVSTKPAGPSEAEQRLERELAEQRRRQEEKEREDRRREQNRLAEERHREEMRMIREEVKALSTNKPDPMLGFFTQFIASQAQSATETARMIRETSAAAQAAGERSGAQMLELARSQRDGVVEASRMSVESMKDLVGTQRTIFEQLLEMRGGGDQPWYADAIGKTLEQIGTVGQALAARASAQQEQEQQQQARAQYIPPQQPRRQAPAAPMNGVNGVAHPVPPPAVQSVPSREGFVDTGARPAGAKFDSKNNVWLLPGGYQVPGDLVAVEGWKVAIEKLNEEMAAMQRGAPAPVVNAHGGPEPTVAGPMNGTSSTPTTQVSAQQQPAQSPKGKKPRGKKGQPQNEAPPIEPEAFTAEQVRASSTEEVLASLEPISDDKFFGAFWPYVQQLRAAALSADKVSEYVGNAYEQLVQAKEKEENEGGPAVIVPMAMQLIDLGHIRALVIRLLPQAKPEYREAVIVAMEADFAEESEPGEAALSPA